MRRVRPHQRGAGAAHRGLQTLERRARHGYDWRVRLAILAAAAVALCGAFAVSRGAAAARPAAANRNSAQRGELVLDHGRVQAQALGSPSAAHAASAPVVPSAAAAPAAGRRRPGLSFPRRWRRSPPQAS